MVWTFIIIFSIHLRFGIFFFSLLAWYSMKNSMTILFHYRQTTFSIVLIWFDQYWFDHKSLICDLLNNWASQVVLMVKNPPANAGDSGLIAESGRSPGGGHGNPLQYSCLENSMDRGAWLAAVHGVTRVGNNWATKNSIAHAYL